VAALRPKGAPGAPPTSQPPWRPLSHAGASSKRIVLYLLGQHVDVTKAIAVGLDEADHAALVGQAAQLRVQPGTLARMLVHAGLTESLPGRPEARAALAWLVRRAALPTGAGGRRGRARG
jgi:hypothetical protein